MAARADKRVAESDRWLTRISMLKTQPALLFREREREEVCAIILYPSRLIYFSEGCRFPTASESVEVPKWLYVY